MNTPPDPLKPPPRPPWRAKADDVVGTFLTGLIFLLPFILTLMILDWIVRQIAGLFGEDTILGSAITGSSTYLFGEGSFGILVILGILLVVIWFIGRLFQHRARDSVQARFDGWIDRIPIIGSIYRPVAQLTRMLGKRDTGELSSMRAVAVRFGGPGNAAGEDAPDGGADVLALLATDKPLFIGGRPRMLVYLPSAPLPMTGALSLVPPENIVEVPGLGVDDLLKFYVSLGTVLPGDLEARTDRTLSRLIEKERRSLNRDT